MPDNVQVLTDDNFSQVLADSQVPVLVDFWAPWCGPCRAAAPVLQELAGEFNERLVFAKINVDENQAAPTKFKVRSIPCFIVFKAGQEIGRIVGHKGKQALQKDLEKLL
ncbi:MAG: thioredoxin [Deltaproteobacteria bacterium]|nr:thioredoxin [Deltaproteobacteria bacterium]